MHLRSVESNFCPGPEVNFRDEVNFGGSAAQFWRGVAGEQLVGVDSRCWFPGVGDTVLSFRRCANSVTLCDSTIINSRKGSLPLVVVATHQTRYAKRLSARERSLDERSRAIEGEARCVQSTRQEDLPSVS